MAEVTNLTPKWEYMSESAVSIERMNELGAEGWELAYYNVYYDREDCAMKSVTIFKRARYEQPEAPKPPKGVDSLRELEDKIYDFVLNLGVRYTSRGAIVGALMGDWKKLTLAQAKDFSKMYGRITLESLREALNNGSIKGSVPAKREVEVSMGWGPDKFTKNRMQCDGCYEFDVKSLTEWLEKVGCRRASRPEVTACLDKILSNP